MNPLNNPEMTLRDLWSIESFKFAEGIQDITDQAKQEAKMEKTIQKVGDVWATCSFSKESYKGSFVKGVGDELIFQFPNADLALKATKLNIAS
jgi:hypothetical protein